jgi:hypothetical protein
MLSGFDDSDDDLDLDEQLAVHIEDIAAAFANAPQPRSDSGAASSKGRASTTGAVVRLSVQPAMALSPLGRPAREGAVADGEGPSQLAMLSAVSDRVRNALFIDPFAALIGRHAASHVTLLRTICSHHAECTSPATDLRDPRTLFFGHAQVVIQKDSEEAPQGLGADVVEKAKRRRLMPGAATSHEERRAHCLHMSHTCQSHSSARRGVVDDGGLQCVA